MDPPDTPHLAIVGATGLVGRELLAILAQRKHPANRLRLLASARSAGSALDYQGESLLVGELTESSFAGIDIALFAAGNEVSRIFAPIATAAGATVIDNSSEFRMDDGVPLVVPEINANDLEVLSHPGIIANPNCSTIIALMAVAPLHRVAGIRRMVVSTYQAASGGGAAMMEELKRQAFDYVESKPLTKSITGRQYLFNLFSHNSAIDESGYNAEEMKLIRETHKILGDDSIAITATCVRVPVLRAHSEAINLTFERPLSADEAREILCTAPGVKVVDDRKANRFPEPLDATGGDDVLVGRIRADISQPPGMGLDLFVCGDQLRKGAALNAIQIAEQLIAQKHAHV